eukprot:TRINITY_DN6821_c0_g1_i10.p1 TRINITY_DN6821_c0_g1~~TRINITY_DN6821_c0_g1_i10.p1  ORF type:complete len:690 (+),score=141.66 TRINITY_DN6821_c0_g1_i10:44-2113(+)
MTSQADDAYGSWASPISVDMVCQAAIRISSLQVDEGERSSSSSAENGPRCLYWLEERPGNAGKATLVEYDVTSTQRRDPLAKETNVASRCHEYGGGAYVVQHGIVYYSEKSDGNIYWSPLHDGGGKDKMIAKAVTHNDGKDLRYADMIVHDARGCIICVQEDHTKGTGLPHEVVNTLVKVSLYDGNVTVLAQGRDFYSSPCLSSDGRYLAFVAWDFPNMPWDGADICLIDLNESSMSSSYSSVRHVAGGKDESVMQPTLLQAKDGSHHLYFISDRSGYWNLYSHSIATGIINVHQVDKDMGEPQWKFGASVYAVDNTATVFTYPEEGYNHLYTTSTFAKEGTPPSRIKSEFNFFSSIRLYGSHLLYIGSSPASFPAIVDYNINTNEEHVVYRSGELKVDRAIISVPRQIEFPTPEGPAYAWLYEPVSRKEGHPSKELPPMIAHSHGGPTGAATPGLDMAIQFWTSRGYSYLDVNYRGSTGHGRVFRNLLRGKWGVADVEDIVSASRHVAEVLHLADPDRLAIQGESAGGFSVLAALTFSPGVFKVGASYYGIGDVEALAKDTHKFESKYLDLLIGPYPEATQLYKERSPIHAVSSIRSSVVLFQGLEDAVVPPNQAREMFEAVKAQGLQGALLLFEGEGHGFTNETDRKCLAYQESFFARVLRIKPHAPEKVEHDNMQECNLKEGERDA